MQNKLIVANSLTISPSEIEAFIETLKDDGRTGNTLEKYRRDLLLLYEFLPENKLLDKEALAQWYSSMKDCGFATRTMNGRISAANSYLEHHGRRELQFVSFEKPSHIALELTRAEYLRLLSAAKILGNERTYLLVKILGTTGLAVQQFPEVTIEAVTAGWISNAKQQIKLPRGLQQELLEYAKHEGIHHGSLFVTEAGQPLDRTTISTSIRRLSSTAKVDSCKANPRCLQKLYQQTRVNIEQEVSRLVEEKYEYLLETEQIIYGWE